MCEQSEFKRNDYYERLLIVTFILSKLSHQYGLKYLTLSLASRSKTF